MPKQAILLPGSRISIGLSSTSRWSRAILDLTLEERLEEIEKIQRPIQRRMAYNRAMADAKDKSSSDA